MGEVLLETALHPLSNYKTVAKISRPFAAREEDRDYARLDYAQQNSRVGIRTRDLCSIRLLHQLDHRGYPCPTKSARLRQILGIFSRYFTRIPCTQVRTTFLGVAPLLFIIHRVVTFSQFLLKLGIALTFSFFHVFCCHPEKCCACR